MLPRSVLSLRSYECRTSIIWWYPTSDGNDGCTQLVHQSIHLIWYYAKSIHKSIFQGRWWPITSSTMEIATFIRVSWSHVAADTVFYQWNMNIIWFQRKRTWLQSHTFPAMESLSLECPMDALSWSLSMERAACEALRIVISLWSSAKTRIRMYKSPSFSSYIVLYSLMRILGDLMDDDHWLQFVSDRSLFHSNQLSRRSRTRIWSTRRILYLLSKRKTTVS